MILKMLSFTAAICLVFLAALYFGQRGLLYQPDPTRIAPVSAGFREAEETMLETSDGERLVAWHAPPRPGGPVVVFFHGNADTLVGRTQRFKQLLAHGIGFVAPAFRGYSGSTGSPSETGLFRDGAAAYAFAAERYAADQIVIWGFSLGSGVAVEIAATRPIGKLVLEAPYTSIPDIAAELLPFAPVRSFLKDQFRSDERIARVKAPILALHGAKDAIVPLRLGKELFALASEPKTFVSYPDGGHADLDHHGALRDVLTFLVPASVAD